MATVIVDISALVPGRTSAHCLPASLASEGLFAPTKLPTLMVAAVETPKGKLM